jgi:large subunit ribosomal protein L22
VSAVEEQQVEAAQEVRAQAKNVRVSARKARLVADTIRGRSVPEARTILAFTQKAAARDVEKVVRSAVANAETHPALQWEGDDLVIASIVVDEGPTLKRFRPRARGRVGRIHKRTCHITVKLVQGAPVEAPRRKPKTEAVPATTEPEAPAETAKPKRKQKEAVA